MANDEEAAKDVDKNHSTIIPDENDHDDEVVTPTQGIPWKLLMPLYPIFVSSYSF